MSIRKSYNFTFINIFIFFNLFFGIKAQAGVKHFNQNDSLVIVRNNIGVPENLFYDELLDILRGEKQHWKSGIKVRIALMKSTTETGELVSRQIYNMNSNQFQKYWLKMVFQGYGTSPRFFTSVDDFKRYLRDTPGAIGVIKLVDSDELERIKVLSNQD